MILFNNENKFPVEENGVHVHDSLIHLDLKYNEERISYDFCVGCALYNNFVRQRDIL